MIAFFTGHNGKYWSVDNDGNITADSSEPVPFIFELRGLSRMTIRCPNGNYIVGEQNGIMTAKTSDLEKATGWEYWYHLISISLPVTKQYSLCWGTCSICVQQSKRDNVQISRSILLHALNSRSSCWTKLLQNRYHANYVLHSLFELLAFNVFKILDFSLKSQSMDYIALTLALWTDGCQIPRFFPNFSET